MRLFPSVSGWAKLVLLAAVIAAGAAFAAIPAGKWVSPFRPWIGAPVPFDTFPQPAAERRLRFSTTFNADAVPADAALHVYALGHVESIEIDGASLPLGNDAAVSRYLHPGANDIAITISRRSGPPFLAAEIKGLKPELRTGPAWTVSSGENKHLPAVTASFAPAFSGDWNSPVSDLFRNWPLLLSGFLAGALLFWQRKRINPSSRILFMAIGAAWLVFIFRKVLTPDFRGFDVQGHLDYVRYLLERGRLPSPAEGWSMYHPPLFYALSALVYSVTHSMIAMKLLPALCGLCNVLLCYGIAKKIWGVEDKRTLLAALFAACAPVNIYMSAYFTNEMMHATLALSALYFCAGYLNEEGGLWKVALACGLALLAKVTFVVFLPVICAAILLKNRESGFRRALKAAAVPLVAALLLAGWFYLRPGGGLADHQAVNAYWQYPGFRTAGYYLGFGEALFRPPFAGFHSFWDGLYSTFWGDGLLGGQGVLAQTAGGGFIYRVFADPRAAAAASLWNVPLMNAVYVLALPLTLLALFGLWRTLAALVRDGVQNGPARVEALMAAIAITAVGFLMWFTARYPSYSSAKAFFILPALCAYAVFAADGLCLLDNASALRSRLLYRAILWGYVAILPVFTLLAYCI